MFNGKKALIRGVVIGVAAFVEQALTELIEHFLNWAKTRKRDNPRQTS